MEDGEEGRAPPFLGAGEALRAAEGWPAAASLDALASGPGGFLILSPHPDDESIGCGGLIAECVARGRPVRVVVLSDGGASHPNSPGFPRPRLAALREEETRAAVAELGLDPSRDLDFLGLPDAALPSNGPVFDAAVNHLLRLAERDGHPAAAVFTTWGHDPHTDHKAARAIGGALARALPSRPKLYTYPVWGWAFAHPIPGFPTPPEPLLSEPLRGVRLAMDRHLSEKRKAVAAHRSQTTGLIADDPGGFRLPPEALALAFRPFELFLEENPAA
ncbi:PIG-L deacetylase family protein [Craurococcus roseus]|uniref:PIG-L deacetylase family protein n=1 Tax=Craurococcus roseus TaxID=77585 RepID=UPI0031DB28BE